jgi:hypothetical protein
MQDMAGQHDQDKRGGHRAAVALRDADPGPHRERATDLQGQQQQARTGHDRPGAGGQGQDLGQPAIDDQAPHHAVEVEAVQVEDHGIERGGDQDKTGDGGGHRHDQRAARPQQGQQRGGQHADQGEGGEVAQPGQRQEQLRHGGIGPPGHVKKAQADQQQQPSVEQREPAEPAQQRAPRGVCGGR